MAATAKIDGIRIAEVRPLEAIQLAHRRIRARARRMLLLRTAVALAFVIFAAPPEPLLAQADLAVQLRGPDNAPPGRDIGDQVQLVVVNRGDRIARGTASAGDRGFMIDLFLTRRGFPEGFARFSQNYFDGVLLKGGRVSDTQDIGPGERAAFRIGGGLPLDTPAGRYRLCARVDPGRVVDDRNEANNIACVALGVSPLKLAANWKRLQRFFTIRPQEPGPAPPGALRFVPGPVAPPSPTGGGKAQRSVLADGTLQIRFADGTVQRLRPDGRIESVQADGSVMVPYSLQVQGAGLPTLPEQLSGWGEELNERLLDILRNILSETEFQAYRQTEEGKPYYDLIDWRLRSIAFLTVP